jgi:V8-like Glu-specific endopeptidase
MRSFTLRLTMLVLASSIAGCAAGMPADDDGEEVVGEAGQPTICGATTDFQHVEQYDGTLGVSEAFAYGHESPVVNIRWRSDLATRYTNPGNVNGMRWCSGTLIAHNLVLTAGHCFDQDAQGWTWPRTPQNTPISSAQGATEMQASFNYQQDLFGNPRTEDPYDIVALREYRLGGLDYAVVQIEASAVPTYGFNKLSRVDASVGDMLAIIGHPAGMQKQIEAGPASSFSGDYIQYSSIDTLGGNSGSGVLHPLSGKLVGVHTNGGCTANGGANSGVRITSILEESPIVRDITQPLVVYARGTDNAVWHRWYDNGAWSSWTTLNGQTTSAPSAGLDADGRLFVFARGNDNAIWNRYYDNGWSAWGSLGGSLASAPAATRTHAGRLVVFARGQDDAVWHKYYDNGWSAWYSLGGATTQDPAATVTAEGRLVVFARNSSGAIVHNYYDDAVGSWAGWSSLGGTLASGPAAAVAIDGRLFVFARGTDNAIWHKYYDNGWTSWSSLGGTMTDQPGAAVDPEGRLFVFARGTDGAVYQKSLNNGTWSSWSSLGGAVTSSPAGL